MIAAVWRSFGWAFEGIGHTWKTQLNFRIHVTIASIVVVAAVWLRVPPRDWAVLALTIGVVFALELMNTAIEALVDLASPGQHDLARIAKDAAAGAVMVAAIAAVFVGIFILGPPLWLRLMGGT
ncbi:MAG: diacylglycerol kinase family protein [Anaerolineae bacterium]